MMLKHKIELKKQQRFRRFKPFSIFCISLIFVLNGYSQTTFVHPSNNGIYNLIDQLAAEQYITVNASIKPYSRKEIAEWLTECSQKENVPHHIKQEILLYLPYYQLDIADSKTELFKKSFFNFFKNSPNQATQIAPLGYFYKDSLFTFGIEPIWGIQVHNNSNGTVTHTFGGLAAFANISNHWGIYANLRDNHTSYLFSRPSYFSTVEGGNFKSNQLGTQAGDYSEMRGGITYSWNWGHIGLIKDHIQWGTGYNSTNILSGLTPSYPMIKLRLNPAKWLDFNYTHGWLVSEVIDSSKTWIAPNGVKRLSYIPKYIAANMFTIKPWRGIDFSFGNSIVYSDMPINPAYLIPVFFYKSADHTLNHGIDNQNSQIFFTTSIRAIKHWHVYGSLFIDEFSIKRIGNSDESNLWSYKVGTRLSNWPVRRITTTAEFTTSSPITYKHRVPTLTFESNKYNLGHYLRDNSEELFLQCQVAVFKRTKLNITYTKAMHGNEYAYVKGVDVVKFERMKNISWSSEIISSRIDVALSPNTFIFSEYSISNIKGYDIDNTLAQTYLNTFTPPYFHGKQQTLSAGFNINF